MSDGSLFAPVSKNTGTIHSSILDVRVDGDTLDVQAKEVIRALQILEARVTALEEQLKKGFDVIGKTTQRGRDKKPETPIPT